MRVAIYARVSREEQVTGYSLDAQLDFCLVISQDRDYIVCRQFIEPGISGTSDKRPAFQAMIRAALAGEFDAVLVHKYDRLFRNRFDAVLYKQMFRERGIAVISATEPGSDDGPAGMLVEGMLEVVAEWYSTNLSSEVRKGIKRKAQNGEPIGPVPPGYHREPGNSWVAVTELGGLIAEAFCEFASGHWSLRSWAEEAYRRSYRTRAGGRLFAPGWQYIFRNKFYVGVIAYDGQEYQGRHAPLVDEVTFMAVQALLDSRPGAHHGSPRTYLLSGLLWSADYDCQMSGTTAKGKYRYYRAKVDDGPELLIPEPVAETQIISQLYHVQCNGATLTNFTAALRLALTVAPSVGVLYEALESAEDRRDLLRGVVTRIVVENGQVVRLELVDGFEFDSTESESPDTNPHPPYPQILTSLLYTLDGNL